EGPVRRVYTYSRLRNKGSTLVSICMMLISSRIRKAGEGSSEWKPKIVGACCCAPSSRLAVAIFDISEDELDGLAVKMAKECCCCEETSSSSAAASMTRCS